MGDWSSVRNRTGQCGPLLSPVIGTLKLVSGDGSSVGTVMSLQCPSRHRPVSGARMSCVWSSNDTHWSGGTPECRPLSRFEDEGFRLALLMSFVSATIILLMSIMFITSCLVKHVKREERRKMERARKSGASEYWHQMDVEQEELQRESIHNQKTTNNNNNNNYNYTQHTATGRAADSQIYSCGDLRSPCRCLHQGKPYPQIIHPAQFSLILSPATDHLMNTHTAAVETHCDGAVLTAGDTHFCRPLLQDPVWSGQHRFNPPVHII